MAEKLIREDDEVVYADVGYLGIERRPEITADFHKSNIDYRINQRPGKINALQGGPGKDWFHIIEYQKSAVRCKVEHPYQLIKNKFGYCKVTYRGLAKITTACTCSLPAPICGHVRVQVDGDHVLCEIFTAILLYATIGSL